MLQIGFLGKLKWFASAVKASKVFKALKFIGTIATLAVGVKGFLQAREMLAKGQDIMANKTAAGGKIPVIYGTRRVGAQIVYMDTAQNRSKDLFVVYAIAVGECEEILGKTIEIDGNSILDGKIYKGGGYVGSDKITSGAGSLNTASQVGDNQYSSAGNLGTDPTLRYSFVFNLHHGAASQTADPMLRASIPNQWSTSHKLNGICYIAASFDYDKKGMYQGVPQITVQVRGKKVYDPRDTNQTFGDASTFTWSSNPALCYLDYITNDEYGKGLAETDINMSTFQSAANACDTLVDQPYYNGSYQNVTWSGTSGNDFITVDDNDDWYQNKVDEVIDIRDNGGSNIFSGVDIKGIKRDEFYDSTQSNKIYIDGTLSSNYTNEAGSFRAKVKRFHCNGYIDTNKNVMDNAKELLANMRGIFTYINGKYELQIEDTGSSTFSITEDHIIGDAGITVDYGNKDKKANKVIVEFFNSQQNYELDTVTVLHNASPNYYSDDGEVLEIKAEFPLVTDYYIAHNMAKAILTRSRNQTTMQFLGTPEMYKLNVGDIVDLTYAGLGFSGKVCRVEALELQSDGLVSVSLIEYFDVYTWQVPAQEDTRKLLKIPTVGALHPPEANTIVFTDTDASNINRPKLTWTEPTDFPVREYRVDVVDSLDNNVFSKIVDTPSVDLSFLPKASNYEAQITAFNGVGIESEAVTKTFTIADDPVKTTEVEINGVTLSTVETYGTVTGKTGNYVKFTNKTDFEEDVVFDGYAEFRASSGARFDGDVEIVGASLAVQDIVTASAGLQIDSSTPASTTNKLYNASGTLYWNGNQVGVGAINSVTNMANNRVITASGSNSLNGEANFTFDGSTLTVTGDQVITGNLTVQGTTTTIDTTNLDVKDKNITLNYGTGDTSANANGAGITIQDAVSEGNDATILWNTTDDEFDFSHGITLPDNKKFKLGTGSDLQIYSDGATGIIQQVGAGVLLLKGQDFYIQNDAGENFLRAETDGAVRLYYDNAGKLDTTSTGIDVTGTVTSDGLTTSGNLDIVSSYPRINLTDTGENPDYSIINANGSFRIYDNNNASNRLSISSTGDTTFAGTVTSDGLILDTNTNLYSTDATLSNYSSSNGVYLNGNIGGWLRLNGDRTGNQRFDIFGNNGGGFIRALTQNKNRLDIANNGDISFYDDTGATQAFFWNASAEKLGIGTTAPSQPLTVQSSLDYVANFKSTDTTAGILLTDSNATNRVTNNNGHLIFSADINNEVANSSMRFMLDTTSNAAGSARMVLKEAGLAIGVSSPDTPLHVYHATTNTIAKFESGDTGAGINLVDNGGTSTIQQTTDILRIGVDEDGAVANSVIAFRVDGSEVARIDADKNFMVATTTPRVAEFGTTYGVALLGQSGNEGQIQSQTNGIINAIFDRRTSDGSIMQFRKDGSTVGSIGTKSSELYIGSTTGNDAFFKFGYGAISPSTSDGANSDNYIDLGKATARYKDLHLSGTANVGQNLYVGYTTGNFAQLTANGSIELRRTAGNPYIDFKSSNTEDYDCRIQQASNGLTFATGGFGSVFERARIDANGNLLVGTTAADIVGSSTATGINLNPNSASSFNRSGGAPLFINRIGSDGTLLQFRKSGSTVGSIGTISFGDLYIADNNNGGIKFDGGNAQILPVNSSGAELNSTLDLGKSAAKFKDLWLSGTMNANAISISGTGTTTLGGALNVQGNINTDSGFIQVGGTTVIDDSRNLTNIGTVSSGAITTSGNLTINDADIIHNNSTFGTFDWRVDQATSGKYVVTVSGTGGAEMELSSDGSDYTNAILHVGGQRVLTQTAGINLNGNLGFNDGYKATFGTGDDLEIYHDGSNSHIKNTGVGSLYVAAEGTGDLFLRGEDDIFIQPQGGQNGIVVQGNGAVTLYHNGSAKLATTSSGIDVTGTTVTDALTVQTAQGDISIANGSAVIDMKRAGTNYIVASNASGNLRLGSGNNFNRLNIANNGDISFYEDTGTTAKLFWDASTERLGLGTNAPQTMLQIVGSGNSAGSVGGTVGIRQKGDTEHDGITITSSHGNSGRIYKDSSGNMHLYNTGGNPNDFVITNAGNIGISTSTPTHKLTVAGTTSHETVRVLTTTGNANLRVSTNNSDFAIIGQGGSNRFDIYDNNASATRLSIDSSGNLLLGKTSANIGTVGHQLLSDSGGDYAAHTSNGTRALLLNRLSSDGEIVDFRKDGTQVGSIGTVAGYLGLASGDTGLLFRAPYDDILPYSSTANSAIDNTIDLGDPSFGFKDLYLSGKAQADTYQFAQNSSATGATDAIYRATTSTLAFKTGSSERMRLNTTGLGIGTTSPSSKLNVLGSNYALTSSGKAINGIHVSGDTNGGAGSYGGAISFGTATGASAITSVQGGSDNDLQGLAFIVHNSGTGSVDAVEAMRIDSTGNLGLGTSSPSTNRRLHVVGAAVKNAKFESASSVSNIEFSDSTTTVEPSLGSAGNNLTFYTNFQERARFDSSGNLLVGKTSSSTGVAGARFSANGFANVTRDGAECINFNRLTSDGTIIDLRKDSVTVGRISTTGGDLLIGTGDCGIRFSDGGDQIRVCTDTGTNRDGAIDLGYTDSRFKDLHLSGKVFVPEIETSGSFTLDVGGNITLNADGSYVMFNDDTINFAQFYQNASGNLNIQAPTQDKDIIFKGNNGGSTITALTLDMSASGAATFNGTISSGFIHANAGTGNIAAKFESTDAGSFINIVDNNSGTFGALIGAEGDDILFSPNNVEAMRISGSNVGIGTSSPAHKLTVAGGNFVLDNAYGVFFGDANTGMSGRGSGDTESHVAWRTNGTERARIDSSGNVGINTSSPAEKLTVLGNQNITGKLAVGIANAHGSFDFYNQNTAYFNGAVTIDDNLSVSGGGSIHATGDISTDGDLQVDTNAQIDGILNIGSTTSVYEGAGGDAFFKNTNSGADLFLDSARRIRFTANGSERARIDSSGNLLVGTTSYNNDNTGIGLGASSFFYATRDGNLVGSFNRLTSDGTIIDFRKDSTIKGQMGILSSAASSTIYLASGATSSSGTGLKFVSAAFTDNILPCRGDGSSVDNLIDLGSSSTRFDDIYATNGTIQTSDRNEKQDIQELTEAEQKVAIRCKGLIRRYKFNSAVEQKGDNARYHFGIIAQDLKDAFEAEGLDAGEYGMFISETWSDSEGQEQTRLGVRYNELLAFIITTL